MHIFIDDVSPLALTLAEASSRIPVEITNRFGPNAKPSLCIGWHDIIDGEYESELFLVDRAFLSVTLSNPGAPHDFKRTRDMILALPELQEFRAAIERVAGPMKSWVLWT